MKRIAICLAVSTSLSGAMAGCEDPVEEVTANEPPEALSAPAEPAAEAGEGEDEEPTSAEVAAAVSGTVQPTEGDARPADVDPESARFGSVELEPGFMPDPARLEGRAGGDLRARTWNPACSGWVTQTPNHILVAALAFSELRIMAHAPGEEDLTLVVRKPDGTFVCNDDARGRRRTTDPMVRTDFPSGEYSIWVGTMRENETPSYRLGISELPNTGPATLRARQ